MRTRPADRCGPSRRPRGAAREARPKATTALSFGLPAGGITLWARVADIALPRWRDRALAAGVSITIARDFSLDRRARPFIRLAFARYTERELGEAVKIAAKALPQS
jgi:DNA-binding transcriptional MocR family regulator